MNHLLDIEAGLSVAFLEASDSVEIEHGEEQDEEEGGHHCQEDDHRQVASGWNEKEMKCKLV